MNDKLDSFGISGMAIAYALIIFFTGTALMVFIYLWRKNRLDMDESPKIQMLHDEEDHGESSGN
jgi:hypothetical protein